MPSLDPDQRAALLGPTDPPCRCAACGEIRIRNYCRECDEFFFGCRCALLTGHEEHRRYVWTPAGVAAIPDFDAMRKRR